MALQQQGRIVAEGRERIFMKLSLSFLKRPLLGWGWANVDRAFKASDWPIKFESDIYLDKAHSHLLEVLVTAGIFGFISYLSILYFAGKRLIETMRKKTNTIWFKTLLVSFLLYIIHTQTNVVSVAEDALFWIVVGIIAAVDSIKSRV